MWLIHREWESWQKPWRKPWHTATEQSLVSRAQNSESMHVQFQLQEKTASEGAEEAGLVLVSYFWMHYSYLINHLDANTLLAYKAHYMVLNC